MQINLPTVFAVGILHNKGKFENNISRYYFEVIPKWSELLPIQPPILNIQKVKIRNFYNSVSCVY